MICELSWTCSSFSIAAISREVCSRRESCVARWATATSTPTTMSGIASRATSPSRRGRASGNASSVSGTKNSTPIESPIHQVNQFGHTSSSGRSPDSHRAPTPTLADARHDTGPLISRNGTALRTLVSTRPERSTGRERLAQKSACSATPPAIASETAISSAVRVVPGISASRRSESHQLKRNEPMSTPGQSRGPQTSSAADPMPAAGQIELAKPGSRSSRNPTRAAAK